MEQKRSLMVVHAHPDDEVFSTGGIIARYAAAGDRVIVVYATRGEAGEMHDPARDPAQAGPRLGEIREEEARAACALLGVSDVYFLGYRDSGMADTDDNKNPAAFMNAPLQEAVDRLKEIMRRTQPQVVVTYGEDGGYGHPDHIMTNRVTAEAFRQLTASGGEPWAPRKLYYTAGSREGFRRYLEGLARYGLRPPWIKEDADINFDDYGLPESEITAHIDISQFAPLKKRALALHPTQIPSDFFYLSIPDEAFREVSGTEYFVRVAPPATPGEREHDLFAGLEEGEAAA